MNKRWSLLGSSSDSPGASSSFASASARSLRSLDQSANQWLSERAMERRLRFDFFSPEVVNDQSWLILLELYRADMQSADISPEQIADAADLPSTTVSRYLSHLTAHDLIEDGGNRSDKTYRLSHHGKRKVGAYFSRLFRHQATEGPR